MKRLLAVMAALALALTGCDTNRAPMDEPPPTVGDEAQLARMRQQAHDILDRWEAAYAAAKQPVFVPLDAFRPGMVNLSAPENEKDIEDHRFVLDGPVPFDVPVGATLRWPSGQTRAITALTATQAYEAMTARYREECGGCSPTGTIRITGARLTTAPIDAIDGPVTVPAWEFTLDGYQARLVMAAVPATEALVPPEAPWDSAHPPLGLSFLTAKSTSDGRTVTVDFTGAQFGADQPCGKDYTLEAVTSVHAVVIIVRTVDYKGLAGFGACNMMGFPRTASVQLPEPLGNRVLLEGTTGHPATVTKA
jgi:predicted small lipoprotein YifL